MDLNQREISVKVNNKKYTKIVPSRMHLADFLREELDLTGTHIGCEHGVCGCCTVLLDEEPVCSCIMLAVQADGHEITTVEGLSSKNKDNGEVTLSYIQEAFWETHGLQCGYCTPGMLLTTEALLEANDNPTEEEIREALSGNICRCTGYVQIVEAVKLAAKLKQESKTLEITEGVK